jgi:hypothetical protein
MDRRLFVNSFLSAGMTAAAAPALFSGIKPELNMAPGARQTPETAGQPLSIRWTRAGKSPCYDQAVCQGVPMVVRGGHGLMTAEAALESAPVERLQIGPAGVPGQVGGCRMTFDHRLHQWGGIGQENVLEGRITLRNDGDRLCALTAGFSSSARPYSWGGEDRVLLPLSAAVLENWSAIQGMDNDPYQECDQFAGHASENSQPIVCHYLEPEESDAGVHETRGPLLIPCIDLSHPDVAWHLAFFADSERPWRIASFGTPQGECGWSFSTRLRLAPREETTLRCFLLIHSGKVQSAWRAYHELAHTEGFPPIAWPRDVLVHYYDFLGPGSKPGKRGTGYDEDLPLFRTFHVGLATQHGYYPGYGDFIHPDRKQWLAMPSDIGGPVEMTHEILKARIRATRQQGAKASIYIHQIAFDDASPAASKLMDTVMISREGKPMQMYWKGPDVAGRLWMMSVAAPQWRQHLLQQVQWIMELLDPDSITIDESYFCVGYDYHPDRRDGLSKHLIAFMKDLRRLVRNYGSEKAIFTSDCGFTSFVQWADGDASDHESMWHELYRKPPVRYCSALGDKPWLPCLWRPMGFWPYQVDLARKVGAGVSLSNGWMEYAGLSRLMPAARERILSDLEELRQLRASGLSSNPGI